MECFVTKLLKANKVKREIKQMKQDPQFLTREAIAANLEKIERTQKSRGPDGLPCTQPTSRSNGSDNSFTT